MTEEQLITSLKEMKEIKPAKEWAFSLKMQLLGGAPVSVITKKVGLKDRIFSLVNQRKLAYSFAVLLLAFLSVAGIMKFGMQNGGVPQQSVAALQEVKSGMETFKTKSENLASASKAKPQEVAAAINEVKVAAKSLTETIKKDPTLAKSVALEINNNKTYLDKVGGTDAAEVNDLYKNTVDPLIKEFDENKNLTDDQKKALDMIKKLHADGNDVSALENILLLMNSTVSNN